MRARSFRCRKIISY